MLRHRRKINKNGDRVPLKDENSEHMNNLQEAHFNHRRLKTELEYLRLENKLNDHIKWILDRRLNELENEMKNGSSSKS